MASNTTDSVFDNGPYVAGSVTLLQSLVAIGANVIAIVLATRLKTLKGLNFVTIFVALASTNTALASVNLFWVQWLFFAQAKAIAFSWFGRIPTQAISALLYAGIGLAFCLALNRFVAIVLPTRYKRVFTKKNTAAMIALSYVVAMALTFPNFFDGCEAYYDPASFAVYIASGTCFQIMTAVGNYGFAYPLVGASLLLNVATFIKLRMRSIKKVGVLGSGPTQAQQARRKQDQRFLLQSFLAVLVYLCVISYVHVAALMTTRWEFFAITVVIPLLQPTGDAVLFLVINSETRVAISALCSCRKPAKTASAVQHVSMPAGKATSSGHRLPPVAGPAHRLSQH